MVPGTFKSFLLILIVAASLLCMSLLPNELKLAGLSLRPVDMLTDLRFKPVKKKIIAPAPVNIVAADSSVKDSVTVQEGVADIVEFKTDDTLTGLDHFYKALAENKKNGKKVRIAYFGDSMIEGDLITQDFRNYLQKAFGGQGVGFVPITSNVAGFRQSIRHSFSSNWGNYNLMQNNPSSFKLGLSGHVFVPSSQDTTACWVKYSGSRGSGKLSNFKRIVLFYGPSNGQNYLHYKDGNGLQRIKLDGTEEVNQLVIDEPSPVSSVEMYFNCPDSISLYGVSFESEDGVVVDNFSFRGNSGLPLTKIPSSVIAGFNKLLDYDLIILHYGLNTVHNSTTDYSWYQRGMENVISHLKSSCPQASFLVVGVSDKSWNNNGTFETDPSVPLLIEAQKRVAAKKGAAFWSLYDAMGGYNSMVDWVNADTALANKDYTHLNFRGSHKVGKMLYDEIMNNFSEYSKTHSQ